MSLLRYLIVVSVAWTMSLGIANAESLPGYDIAGTCVKNGSATPKKQDDHVEWYYQFSAKPESSKLQSRVLTCPNERLAEFKAFAQQHAVARTGVSKRDLEWWDEAISDPITLSGTTRCGVLKNDGVDSGLLILRTKLDAKRSRYVSGNELLSVIQLDRRNRPTRFLSQHLTTDSDMDLVRRISVKFLCDADADGRVELLLTDRRYAGYGYLQCRYEADFSVVSCHPIAGASGD